MRIDLVLALLALLVGGGGIAGYIKTLRAARHEDVVSLIAVQDTLRADYQRLKLDNIEMRAEYAKIKLDNLELRTDLARLKAENAELREQLARLEREYRQLKGTYGDVLNWACARGYEPPS